MPEGETYRDWLILPDFTWNGELIDMYMLEAMKIEILTHLYEKGIIGINEGGKSNQN
jgi:hypothetical protein